MFTADESGTVTLPLTIPPGSLTMGHHGPGAPHSATQGLPLGAGLSLGSQVGAAAQPTSILPSPFLLPTALPMQPVHQVMRLGILYF